MLAHGKEIATNKHHQITLDTLYFDDSVTVKSSLIHQQITHIGFIKFSLQPLLWLWLFPGSSSQHRGPERQQHDHQASQSPPPLEPGDTKAKFTSPHDDPQVMESSDKRIDPS